MYVTRNQRISKQKAMEKYQTFKRVNKSMKKSVAMMGTTVMMGLYVSPVAQVLVSEKASAATVGLTSNQFINTLLPSAQKVTKGKNLYTSVMLAQAALETGMGNSTLSKAPNHNLFGIKGDYNGESVTMNTLEDSGNQNYYQIKAKFRKYPSYEQSLEDYTKVLLNGPAFDQKYYAGAWKSNTSTYKDATAHLTGRYATDSAYGSKLNRIIETYDLTKYDGEHVIDSNLVEEVNHEIAKNSYTIVAGDSLYGIAHKTGVALDELLRLNNLQLDSIIHPGQTLKVTEKQEATKPVEKPVEATKPVEKPVEEVKPVETATNTYTIVAGDSLYAISRKTGVSLAELLRLNNLQLDSIIHPGQTLKVTGKSVEATKPVEVSKPVAPVNEIVKAKTYTIKAGDNLWRIAKQNGLTLAQLKSLNGLTSNMIHPNQVLKLA